MFRGTALYVGALLGPGLLLLPGLAARAAGPASILAWAGLLVVSALLAVVFATLGRAHPDARGVAGYTAAGLGPAAGRVVSWCFLAGVVGGAPVVCLIGASYVTGLTGGGLLARCMVGAALLLVALALTLGGVRASSTAQLVLVTLLIVIIAVAVAGSAPAARAGNWTPFAPHGWGAIGRAAAVLMLSFAGWEAVAPLTARFRDPGRQLPRVIGAAFGVTAVLYLSLAVTTIAVLGPAAATDVPLADLLVRAAGETGRVAAAVAAVVLTLGAVNAYLSGAAALARQLAGGAVEAGGGRGCRGGRGEWGGRGGRGAAGRDVAVPGRQRPGRAGRDRPVRGGTGRDHAADRAADHLVPGGVPGLHGVGGADVAGVDARGRGGIGAGGAGGAGVLRLAVGRGGRGDRRGGGDPPPGQAGSAA